MKKNKEVIYKNCAPFTDCISQVNNTEIDNAKDLVRYCDADLVRCCDADVKFN